jgi:predicted ATPase
MEMVRRAISDVIAMNHPIMLCRAVPWAFGVFFWNGDLKEYEEYVDRLVTETHRHHLATFQMIGEAMKGIALLARSKTSIGLAMLKGAIEKLESQRFGAVAGLRMPLAEALAATDRADEALDTINQAIAQARHCNFLMDMPDMLRARAEVLMRKSNPDFPEAERSFVEALDLARHQGALGYELRAAIGLARLWLRQGRHEEAYDMLAPIYGRFTEGFHTSALRTARELLADSSSRRSSSCAAN